MYCALAGHRRAYWIFLVLALGVKTDVALYMVPFGLYLLLAQRDRRLGWGTMGLSLAWFLLAAAVTRAFAPAGATPAYLKFYGVYGDSLPAIALDILAHPWRIPLSLVSRPLLTLLATCGFLFLADWRSALLILPPAAVVLLSPDPDFRMLAYYRSAPIIPFLFFATALGAAQLARGPRPAKGLPDRVHGGAARGERSDLADAADALERVPHAAVQGHGAGARGGGYRAPAPAAGRAGWPSNGICIARFRTARRSRCWTITPMRTTCSWT